MLNLIRSHRSISRSQIAAISGLSSSTITHVVRDLCAENLVYETGTTPTGKVGRDPVQLELNARSHSAIGIQIGDSRLVGVLMDLQGDVLNRIAQPVKGRTSLSELLPIVARLVEELVDEEIPLLGIGIAVAGMINTAEGTVFAPNLSNEPLHLSQELAKLVRFPVEVDNEANAMLLAEQTNGILRDRSNALCINVGLGIGSGVLVNGQIYSGTNGGAGEIGHTIIQMDGPLCSCGSRGCLETFSGAKGLAQALLLGEGEDPTTEVLLRSALENPDNKYHLETAARVLGIGLANAANAFNPEIILCGGSHFGIYHPVMETVRESFRRHVLPINRGVTLREISLDDPEAVGAGIMILNRFFGAPPERTESSNRSGHQDHVGHRQEERVNV